MIKAQLIISADDYDALHVMLKNELYAPSHDLLVDELEPAKMLIRRNFQKLSCG